MRLFKKSKRTLKRIYTIENFFFGILVLGFASVILTVLNFVLSLNVIALVIVASFGVVGFPIVGWSTYKLLSKIFNY